MQSRVQYFKCSEMLFEWSWGKSQTPKKGHGGPVLESWEEQSKVLLNPLRKQESTNQPKKILKREQEKMCIEILPIIFWF